MFKNFRNAYVAATLASFCLLGMGPAARAGITIDASVGGAPTGVSYANFDDLDLGNAGGVSNGITVSFSGNGRTVEGAESGLYAAPFLSNDNGLPFGDPTNGADTTRYLSTGTGSVTLLMPGLEKYIGLLWGSVDNYNTLSLYNGNTLVWSLTGADVAPNANGNQGVNGTFYVNITSTDAFDRVVARSSSYAFELDNVAYNPSAVPEPSSCVLALLGGAGMFAYRQRRRKALPIA